MASASEVTFELHVDDIAYISEAVSFAKMGLVPAGSYKNREYTGSQVDFGNAEEYDIDLLYDPQTSGGLLFSVAAEYKDEILQKFIEAGMDTKVSVIGTVKDAGDKWIRLIKG